VVTWHIRFQVSEFPQKADQDDEFDEVKMIDPIDFICLLTPDTRNLYLDN
jgi:glutaredoxin-related protein